MSKLSQLSEQFKEHGILIDAGVLSGGRSTRMGGNDKGLVSFRDQPLVKRAVELLSPLAEQHMVLINCNRHFDDYKRLSPRICSDLSHNQPGPLAGIESLLSHTSAALMFIMPCDTPLVDEAAIMALGHEALFQVQQGNTLRPIALKTPTHKHPLHCCIPAPYLSQVQSALANQHHKLIRWFEEQDAIWVDAPSEALMENANSPLELGALA